MTRIRRILVPTDFSETSDHALAYARGLSETFGATLHLLYVMEDPYVAGGFAPELYGSVTPEMIQSAFNAARAHLAERMPPADEKRFRGTTEIMTGPPAKSIVECAIETGADLIIMGTHGRSGVAHLLLGSVAERVVRTAPCPVLTLRHALAYADARVPVTAVELVA